MPKLVIVMTFYERHAQLYKTLESFRRYDPDTFSVVIVDDNSPHDIILDQLPFEVTILKLKDKCWVCPAPVFNFGFIEALKQNPEFVIIQNAECYHNGDILGYIFRNLTYKNYLTFAAYSLGQGEDVTKTNLNKCTAIANGDSGWYNHSVYRPEALHFCTAITAANLRKINGFDERFAFGIGYEDDYLLHQIRTLGLKVKIVDSPFVFHQYHYDIPAFNFSQDLYNQNSMLYSGLKTTKDYRAVHYITSDL